MNDGYSLYTDPLSSSDISSEERNRYPYKDNSFPSISSIVPSFEVPSLSFVQPPKASFTDDFLVHSDPDVDDTSLPPFLVSRSRGFLPRVDPVIQLPHEFKILESLLERMPIVRTDGTPGLLATGHFGKAVDSELMNLSSVISKYQHNLPLINALYRDYSFITSAYLLEPYRLGHQRYIQGQEYGLARDVLPQAIAEPLSITARISGFKPWLEYAGSYALYNYKLIDTALPPTYDNISLIRAFEKGLDRTSSEAGFILVHISMACHSGSLVTASLDALDGCAKDDRFMFTQALLSGADSLGRVNDALSKMWTKNKPSEYAVFRTFIFGILNQSMFPNGVIYEGVSEEPMYFRGGSGANDSMIPLCDDLLEIKMPDSPLTDILKDFRQYRPGNHREFLEWMHNKAAALGIREYALRDRTSSLAYLKMLDEVRQFRWRHWLITKEYVLKRSKHKTATGGSPILQWLPSQLIAVLDQIVETSEYCDQTNKVHIEIINKAKTQLASLQKEVQAASNREVD